MPSERRGRVLALDDLDNVANALEPLEAGDRIEAHGRQVTVKEPVPLGHKVALGAIPAASPVIKYGEPIGLARCEIEAGCHVHTHNVEVLFDDWLAARTGTASP
ncbi:MAG: UxaA family hydrolase [Betaproteobacteria bacterium]|nr:UxaA family hydrolase [Betaproteobacteria bacterium]